MKKIISLYCIILGLFIFGVHKEAFAQTPSSIVENFIDLSFKGKSEEAYQYLAKSVKETISLSEFNQNIVMLQTPIGKMLLGSFKNKIIDVKEDSNTATVIVEQVLPDFDKILPAIRGPLPKKYPNVKSEQDMINATKEYFGGKIPTITKKQTYKLIIEDNKWKVIPPQFVDKDAFK